jgi:glycosyltransferase involved in cell wall biosynthesis
LKSKVILFIVNVDWFFVSHRLPIALATLKTGYEVHLACYFTDKSEYFSSLGIKLHPLPLSRGGTGFKGEAIAFYSILKTIKKINPDIIHYITIKPVLYGGIASRLLGIPGRVASISGLGYVFVSSGFKSKILRLLVSVIYRLALRSKKTKVILQNSDDENLLLKSGIISQSQATIIRGSGVDLSEYQYKPEPDGVPVVAMASRLLRDKGVFEFVQAAGILNDRGVKARFWLIGDTDSDNPATVTSADLDSWKEKGPLEILGRRIDIPDLFARSNIVALPSYYGEGLPKVLVEAAACGRAVVTTDHPGCRDAIEPNRTGLLVPVKNAQALADAIQRLIENPDLRKSFGKAGRRLAEKEFDIEKVVKAHMEIYDKLEI